MNVVELIRVLQNKIATSTSGEDILYLTKVMEKLNLGMIKTVPSYASLINLTIKDTLGELYFVESEEKVYYRKLSGSVYVWVSLIGNEKTTEAYAWGSGFGGVLGDNTTVSKNSPVSVVGGFTDWAQISAGYRHNLGLRSNGTIWSWGENGYDGRLGDGTLGVFANKSSPVSVIGGFTDWVQVSASFNRSVALRSNGTIWAWGGGTGGRLGNGSTGDSISPVSVIGGFTDWTQVSFGSRSLHTIAIRENGTAWGWGYGGSGQLGNGTALNRTSPVSVVGGFTDWVQTATGTVHSLGLRADGTAWAWGNGASGRLGDNTTIGKSSPVSVVGGYTDWIQLSAGNYHSLGIRANGTAWAWGVGSLGRLGTNATVTESSPVSVVGGFTDWVQLAGGGTHSLGVRATGTAWAWGYGTYGRLGSGTTTTRSSPVSVVGGFTDWVQVGGGSTHSLAIKSL